jgi:hypothetical protein
MAFHTALLDADVTSPGPPQEEVPPMAFQPYAINRTVGPAIDPHRMSCALCGSEDGPFLLAGSCLLCDAEAHGFRRGLAAGTLLGRRGRTLMLAVAEMLCQRCGARTEAVIADGRPPMACGCGGMRQVVRVVHHPGGEAPASPAQVERNVRHRSDEEALPHGRRRRP